MRLSDETPQTRTYHEIAWQLGDLVHDCCRYSQWESIARAALAERLPDRMDQLRWWNSEFGKLTQRGVKAYFRKETASVDVEPTECKRVITVRMTNTLHDRLKDEAAGRGISLNSLCVERLRSEPQERT
jgi:pyrroloquinoline quinone (PQQ) biosynthesis protein C